MKITYWKYYKFLRNIKYLLWSVIYFKNNYTQYYEINNKNTNEYILKLMTNILTFRVHVNLKSVLTFYLIQQWKNVLNYPSGVEGKINSRGKSNASCPHLATSLLYLEESWKLLKNFHKNQVKIWDFRKILMKCLKNKENMKNFRKIFEISIISRNNKKFKKFPKSA